MSEDEREETQHFHLASAFGTPFVDPSNDQKIVQQQWNKNAPDWRQAVHGLNLDGTCENKSCRAYKKRILCKWGFRNNGVFDFVHDQSECKCPICGKFVEPKNCGFCDTFYRATGLKKPIKGGGPFVKLKDVTWKWAPADHYTTFKEMQEDLVIWGKLKLEVKRK
ncbi:hypothetical protein RUND412_006847 [Rhizina undulata]